MPTPFALECRDLRKGFPGVLALDGVSVQVQSGELHALVGENGAGKSTLVKIIAGQLAPDDGELVIDGSPVTQFTPQTARALGVTMVPQHPDLFHSLSALENLFVGDWPRSALGTISWREMTEQAERVLAEMGVSLDLHAQVSALTVAERQLLQIARALLAEARLLILDEPTAPLAQEETDRLFELVRRLHARGVSMIYISHRLSEVFELAERVTVLRDGRLVKTLPLAEVDREGLVGMMVGSRAGEKVAHARQDCRAYVTGGTPVLLAARGLTRAGEFEDASVQVRSGEIVGIAGVAGSGRNALLRALAGVERPDEGVISMRGRELRPGGPRLMRDEGVSFVPSDRHHEALILPMSVRENTSIACLREFAAALGLVRLKQETAAAAELATKLDVRATSLEQPVGTLSGGNQQKVALASRLATRPEVLLLEDPTQGVDVGARAEIHRLMRELSDTGVGIVLVSSDLGELLALSDRVLVMHRGRLVGEFERAEATQEKVLDLALGTTEAGVAATPKAPRRAPMRELGLAGVLILLTIVVSLGAPSFCTVQNLTDILVNNSYLLIAGVGMTVVILTAGIDISVGSILGVCATVAAASAEAGWPVVGVLAAALLGGLGLGAVNAGLVTRARIPPIIATLATLTVFRHVLIHFTGGRWINLPPGFREFGLSVPLGVPLPVWAAGATVAAGMLFARWTALGRSIYAVGSNAEAAEHLGIRVRSVRMSVYLLMGVLTGLAAFVYAGRWSAIQTNAGLGFEMVVITAVVVGGTNIFGGSGTILGTVIGVLLLGVISSSLTPLHIEPTWEKAFQGGLILVAVVVDALRSRKGANA